MVDLHVSLWGVTAPPEVFWEVMAAHREGLALGPVEVFVPDPAGTALVIALHASQHGALIHHVATDLKRALDRFERSSWADASARAAASGSQVAFRQGLTMLPAGQAMLAELGLAPATSRQSALRRKGVELPAYLYESLPLRERLSLVRARIAPPRAEIVAFVEPRAAENNAWLVAAHVLRLMRLPVRSIRLALRWRRAGRSNSANRSR
jgi:hypothetical protein